MGENSPQGITTQREKSDSRGEGVPSETQEERASVDYVDARGELSEG